MLCPGGQKDNWTVGRELVSAMRQESGRGCLHAFPGRGARAGIRRGGDVGSPKLLRV